MEQLLNLRSALNLPQLGARKTLLLGAVALMVLAVVAFVALHSSQQMGLLYSGLDPAEAGKISQRLDELKVPYEARGDGGTILVAASDVARVRMELAASGLPHQGGAGYELLDSESPMNMTSFMQRVQRVRALEGELARTINTLNGVKSARVHIVMPEREGFSRETPQPTASVTVTMTGPGRMSPTEAAAIRLLVAGAVPRMKQEDVSVLDPMGVVLAADDGSALAVNRLGEMRNVREQSLQQAILNLLEPLVGHGKVRVAASVDLETARETQREEKFDPLTQVERSRQTQNDRDSSEEKRAQQPVTVGQNVPNQQANPGQQDNGNTNTSTSSHSGETVNYEINSVLSERVREPGELRRLAIAVVVDGTTDAQGNYVPRSSEELERLSALVRSAVGFDEKRGDRVTVESLHFIPLNADGTEAPDLAAANGLPLKYAIPAGVLLLAGLGGGAYVMASRRRKAAEVLRLAEEERNRLALAEPGEDLFSLTAVGGQPRSPLVVQLNNLVDERPDEALAVLRGWIETGKVAA